MKVVLTFVRMAFLPAVDGLEGVSQSKANRFWVQPIRTSALSLTLTFEGHASCISSLLASIALGSPRDFGRWALGDGFGMGRGKELRQLFILTLRITVLS